MLKRILFTLPAAVTIVILFAACTPVEGDIKSIRQGAEVSGESYTVTFNINGAGGTAPSPQTIKAGSSVILPGGNGFFRTGLTFGGWNINPSGTGINYNAGAAYSPFDSITLYAKWDSIYEGEVTEGDFTYRDYSAWMTVTGYTGTGGNVTIPAGVNGKPITGITSGSNNDWWDSDGVFAEKNITSVTIPGSVTYIGDGAFFRNQLSSVTIPNNVTYIGENAFFGNQLSSVIIPNSVISIEARAFGHNQLSSITIGYNVTDIGYWAFENNLLTSVAIPGSATFIAGSAFANCMYLTEITVAAGNPAYSSAEGVLYNKNKTILITWPAGKTGAVTIPNTVTSIGYAAFHGNQLSNVTIPNGVTEIGRYAFDDNRLTVISIPDSVTEIGDEAFAFNQLISITIPNNITSIGYRVFSYNRLTSVIIPISVTNIEEGAFYDNELTSITIGANVTLKGGYYGSFGNNFEYTYNTIYSKAAGTYTRPDTYSSTWTKVN